MTASPAIDRSDALTVEAPQAPVRPASAMARPGGGVFTQPLVPLLTTVVVAALVVVAVSYARTAGLVAALWGAGGLATVVWLRTSRGPSYDLAFGGLIMLGFLTGNLMVGNPLTTSIMFTVANMLDVGCAVLLARRFAPTLNMSSVEGATRFLLSAAIIAPLPAATFAGIMLNLMVGAPFLTSFQTWWFGHAMGASVIGAFGLALTSRHLVQFRNPVRLLEAIGLTALLIGACLYIFTQARLPLAFALTPILLLVAVRFRVLGVSLALVIIAILAVGGAMAGMGPFHDVDDSKRAMIAQILVLLGYMPILLVAALLEERDRLAERARAGQARAERASEAKSRLLANVAHEIKSPVGGVIGIGDLWRTGQLGPVSETQAEMAEMLVKTARQVEALAHDLLDVARAESGAVKLEIRPVDIPGLLEDVRRSLALRPDAAGLKLQLLCEGDGLVALADSQRLVQVLSNLASNAVKYGSAGGTVIFQSRRVDDGVRIEIIDKGPGISPEKQAQLFEPFNRLGLERSTVEGHGIGLALAKRLTELQGGTIGVSSVPGEGATFWVELPGA
ncbi:histidine kinase [Rhizobium sp. CRIBSB]|nr:histidine kinase [Rhizobium sp. CRIBSB]